MEELPALTVMVADPDEAIRLAGTEAVNCVALTKVVGRAALFQSTIELEVKPAPLTRRVKAAAPA